MKVGFFIKDGLVVTEGGGFSYIEKFVKALDEYSFQGNFDFVFISSGHQIIEGTKHPYEYVGIIPRYLKKIPFIGHVLSELDKRIFYPQLGQIILRRKGIDLTLYTSQAPYPCLRSPFIVMNWDIGHLSTYPFPEILRTIGGRQKFYNYRMERAILVLAESESGKKELLRFTRIGEHKIRIVPIFGGGLVRLKLDEKKSSDILNGFNLKEQNYFLYPAQYWAHKNHIGLLEGFARFVQRHPQTKLVLCGTDKGNKQYVHDTIKRLGLEESVILLGYVTDEELSVFYRNTIALVMASYFGPTNMPPIEAMDFGIPVVCSDIEGHREILGEAGVYFNPQDYDGIADGLNQVVEERSHFVELIKKRKQNSIFDIEHALQYLDKHLNEAIRIRTTWN